MSFLLTSQRNRTLPAETAGRPKPKRPFLLQWVIRQTGIGGRHDRNSPYSTTRRGGLRRSSTRRTSTTRTPASLSPVASAQAMALSSFLQNDVPTDVLPKILAFCGPQTVAALSQINRQWRDLCLDDSTWRVLCEELYKWSDGDELPSTSWREYYQNNPCVPIDYSTLPAALSLAETPDAINPRVVQQTRSIRVLLRPGDHVLREAINIEALEGVQVTIETMKGGPFVANHEMSAQDRNDNATPLSSSASSLSPSRRLARRAAKMRNRMNCRRSSSAVDPHHDVLMMMDAELEHPPMERLSSSRPVEECATLILRTRRHNEPLFRVRQGTVKLANLELLHNSHGMDIWNGNAAIQIQPPVVPPPAAAAQQQGGNNTVAANNAIVRPSMYLESIEVLSHSGRGIVNIDGGFSSIQNCYVHDCAATGIYVGGPGTQAIIERTDVLHNGNGTRNRRGVGRGHSGVYLEQGKAVIRDCNISRNSLTGISAVSLHNTSLNLEQSDVVANGAAQLEMPRGAPVGMSMDLERNNRLAAIGLTRARSGLVYEPTNLHHAPAAFAVVGGGEVAL